MLRVISTTTKKLTSIYSTELKRHLGNQINYVEKIRSMSMDNPQYRVRGDNILIGILTALNIEIDTPSGMDVISSIRSKELGTANAFGIVHADNGGSTKQNNFYPCTEVFVLDRNLGSIAELLSIGSPSSNASWKDMVPVKVIATPHGWNPINIPHGNHENTGEVNSAVMSINMVHLGVMFRMWLKEQANVAAGETESTAQFIARYVIPNMLASSRMAALLPVIKAALDDNFYTVEDYNGNVYAKAYVRELIEAYRDTLQTIPVRRLRSEYVLGLISIDGTYSYADHLPDLQDRYTSQSSWAYILAALPIVEVIVSMLSLDGHPEKDTEFANELKQFRSYYRGNRILKDIKDNNLREDVELRIENIEMLMGL